jgi:glycosyltransferase involved in cell wall biosynthesis
MRCLIVVPSLTRAGAETQAIELANGLSARGHQLHLCCFERQLDQRDRLSKQVQFHHVLRKSKYDRSLVAAIARIIDLERIEIVQGVLQFAVLVAWLSAKQSRRRPPVVAGIHTTINRGVKQEVQDRLIYRRMLSRLPAVVFVCDYQREYWIRKYPELRPLAHVVHNGVDLKRFQRSQFEAGTMQYRADLGIPESAFVFACIAGFRPEKGHRLLIKAFSELPSNVHLVLAGDGDERPTIEAQVRSVSLVDRVHFVGSLADVRTLIVASNATILASTAVETFSMAMLESMALEVPVIAPEIGGLPEAIEHEKTGLLFPIGDVLDLAMNMKKMAKSPALVRSMGLAAADKVCRSFTLEKMIDGYGQVLEALAPITCELRRHGQVSDA